MPKVTIESKRKIVGAHNKIKNKLKMPDVKLDIMDSRVQKVNAHSTIGAGQRRQGSKS